MLEGFGEERNYAINTDELISNINKNPNNRSNVVQLNEEDFELLRSSILFKNWNRETFRAFVDDGKIILKRFKYKEVIAKEKECNEKLFIIKSGDVFVWIKVKRLNLKKYQKIIERYNHGSLDHSHIINTNIDTLKEKYSRDENLKTKLSNQLKIDSNSIDSIKTSKNIKNEENQIKQAILPPIPSTLTTGYKYNILTSRKKLNEEISKSENNSKNTQLPKIGSTINKTQKATSNQLTSVHLPSLNKKHAISNMATIGKKQPTPSIPHPPPRKRKRRSRLPRVPKFKPIKSILNNRLSSMLKSAQHRASIADESGQRVRKIRFSNISIVYKSNSARSIRLEHNFNDLAETNSDLSSKQDLEESEQDENELHKDNNNIDNNFDYEEQLNSARDESESDYEDVNTVTKKEETIEKGAEEDEKEFEENEGLKSVDQEVTVFDSTKIELLSEIDTDDDHFISNEEMNKHQSNKEENKLNDDSLLMFRFLAKEEIELKNIEKIKTELPEIWTEGFKNNNIKNNIYCFVKMMNLYPNEFFVIKFFYP